MLFIWLMLAMPLCGYSQSADTAHAHQQISDAYQLRAEARYDSSASLALLAADGFEKERFALRSAHCLNIAAGNLRLVEKLDRAENLNKKAIKIIRETVPADPQEEVRALLNLGMIAAARTEFSNAIDFLNKAESIARRKQAPAVLRSTVAGNLGYVHDDMGNYDTALAYFEEAVMLLGELRSPPKDKLAKLYNNIGVTHSNKGDFQTALEFYEQEVALNRERFGENHPNVAGGYINLGAAAYRTGDIGLAISYFKRAHQSLKKSMGTYHSMTGIAANNIGLSYMELKQFSNAIRYLKLAIDIKKETRGAGHPDVAVSYKNLGSIYSEVDSSQVALNYFKKALAIEEKNLGMDHPQLAETYFELGGSYLRTARPEIAIKYLLKARGLTEKYRGERHPKMVQIHQKLGTAYAVNKKFDRAINHFNEGVNGILKSAEITGEDSSSDLMKPDDFAYPSYAVEILLEKAKAQYAYFNQTENPALLESSLQSFLLLSNLLDRLQLEYASEESKLLIGKKSHAIYEAAIKTAYELFRLKNDQHYLQYAFYFSEKSKDRVLLESVQRKDFAENAGIPDRLIDEEESLRHSISRIQQQILEQTHQTASKLKDSLFILQTRLSDHISVLKKGYPNYYRATYENSIPSVSQIQQKLQKQKRTLVEYFYGQDAIYATVITSSKIHITPIPLTPSLQQAAANFPAAIADDQQSYAETAYALYHKLIAPIESFFSTNKLLIVPDGQLARIPFEALLTSLPDNISSQESSFLINDYEINYAGSIALSAVLEPVKKRSYSSPLLAFAPSFENQTASVQYASRRSWQPLVTSTYEVNEIAKLFKETTSGFFSRFWDSSSSPAIFMDDEATEDTFKSMSLSDYRIIHFATHAFASEGKNNLSGIVFSPSSEKNEDGVLFSSEIYSLDLKNELVVLGACDTGRGPFVKGEGVMGLSRAFRHAGTSNLLVSLWKTEDRSTTQLMITFYKHVLDGLPYPQALQKAKMQMAVRGRYAHPKYWAPFVLYGN